jgi:hypothetical protein
METRPKTRDIYAAVFGKGDDLVLVPHPADVRSLAVCVANDLPFCGVMAFIGGECHAKCEPSEAAVSTMMSAVTPFAHYVAAKVARVAAWSELT